MLKMVSRERYGNLNKYSTDPDDYINLLYSVGQTDALCERIDPLTLAISSYIHGGYGNIVAVSEEEAIARFSSCFVKPKEACFLLLLLLHCLLLNCLLLNQGVLCRQHITRWYR